MAYVLTGLFLISCIVSINCLIVCEKDACDTAKCVGIKYDECKKPNQDVRRGGFCGCCFVCYTTLDENEQCPLRLSGGPPPTSGCREGLICKNGKCVKESC